MQSEGFFYTRHIDGPYWLCVEFYRDAKGNIVFRDAGMSIRPISSLYQHYHHYPKKAKLPGPEIELEESEPTVMCPGCHELILLKFEHEHQTQLCPAITKTEELITV